MTQSITKVDIAKKATKDGTDAALSAVPFVGPAWDIAKAVFGAALALRHERASEWLLYIYENLIVFRAELFTSTEFQDAFVYTLEKYIRERNENKRELIKNIFLDFATTEQKARFELERLVNTASTVSIEAIELLSYIEQNILPEMKTEYEQHNGQIIQRLSEKVEERLGDQKGEHHDTNKLRDTVAELINLGVFRSWTESYNTLGGGGSSLEYNLTIFGSQFIEYVKK